MKIPRDVCRTWFPPRAAWVLLLAVIVGACFTAEVVAEPATSDVSGQWTSSFGRVEQMPVTLALNEVGGGVSGSGTIGTPFFGTHALVASGVYARPTLAMALYPGPYQPFQFSGAVAGDSIVGVLNGSGFADEPVIFRRVLIGGEVAAKAPR